jgi:hypothetical protein
VPEVARAEQTHVRQAGRDRKEAGAAVQRVCTRTRTRTHTCGQPAPRPRTLSPAQAPCSPPCLLRQCCGHRLGGVALGADQVPNIAVHLHCDAFRRLLVVPGVHAYLSSSRKGMG